MDILLTYVESQYTLSLNCHEADLHNIKRDLTSFLSLSPLPSTHPADTKKKKRRESFRAGRKRPALSDAPSSQALEGYHQQKGRSWQLGQCCVPRASCALATTTSCSNHCTTLQQRELLFDKARDVRSLQERLQLRGSNIELGLLLV